MQHKCCTSGHKRWHLTLLKDPRTAPNKKTGAINGRISGTLRKRLDAIFDKHRVTDAQMLEDALTALADHVEAAGKYEWPMKMVSAKDYPELDRLVQLNEAQRAQETIQRARHVFFEDPATPGGLVPAADYVQRAMERQDPATQAPAPHTKGPGEATPRGHK